MEALRINSEHNNGRFLRSGQSARSSDSSGRPRLHSVHHALSALEWLVSDDDFDDLVNDRNENQVGKRVSVSGFCQSKLVIAFLADSFLDDS